MNSPHPTPFLALLWRMVGCLFFGSTAVLAEPTTRIFDSTRMLSPSNHLALAQELEEFFLATGCHVFVKAETYLESGITARTIAHTARRDLVATGPAVLFLIDRARSSMTISQSPELWQRYPTAQLFENLRAALVQTQTPNTSSEQRLISCITVWLEGIRQLETERQAKQRVIPPTQRPMIIVVVSLLGLGTLVAILLGWRDQQSLAAGQQQTLFPEIEVDQRLEGPFGGGVIASLAPVELSHR